MTVGPVHFELAVALHPHVELHDLYADPPRQIELHPMRVAGARFPYATKVLDTILKVEAHSTQSVANLVAVEGRLMAEQFAHELTHAGAGLFSASFLEALVHARAINQAKE